MSNLAWFIAGVICVGVAAVIVVFVSLTAAASRDDQLIRKARDL